MRKHPDPLTGLDLNLLYTFRLFAESGSLRATATRIGRSQPAVSARLHQLERELGAVLFARQGRRLHLTPFGRSLLARLDALFSGLSGLVDLARESTDRPTGLVRVGALPTVGVYLLAPRIAKLAAKRPGIELDVRLALGAINIAGLRSGELDLALGVGDPPEGDLSVIELGRARAVLVTRAGSHRLPKRALRPAELRALPWVAYGRIGDAFFDAVWQFLERHRLDAEVCVRVPHIQMLKALVSSGVGVGILPDYTIVETDLETRRVAGLDVSEPIWLASRPSSASIPVVAAVIEAIVSGGRERRGRPRVKTT